MQSLRNPREDLELAFEYMSLEFRTDSGLEIFNLGVFYIYINI